MLIFLLNHGIIVQFLRIAQLCDPSHYRMTIHPEDEGTTPEEAGDLVRAEQGRESLVAAGHKLLTALAEHMPVSRRPDGDWLEVATHGTLRLDAEVMASGRQYGWAESEDQSFEMVLTEGGVVALNDPEYSQELARAAFDDSLLRLDQSPENVVRVPEHSDVAVVPQGALVYDGRRYRRLLTAVEAPISWQDEYQNMARLKLPGNRHIDFPFARVPGDKPEDPLEAQFRAS